MNTRKKLSFIAILARNYQRIMIQLDKAKLIK
jgi:hypothetical protein